MWVKCSALSAHGAWLWMGRSGLIGGESRGEGGWGQAFCQPLILGYWLLFILWLQSFRAAVGKIRPASGNRCLCLCVCGVGKGGGLVCLSDSVVFWKWVNKVFEEEQNKKLKNSQYIPAPIVCNPIIWDQKNLALLQELNASLTSIMVHVQIYKMHISTSPTFSPVWFPLCPQHRPGHAQKPRTNQSWRGAPLLDGVWRRRGDG